MSSAVSNDVLPYTTVVGNRASLAGINAVGMKRRGFTREEIQALRNAVHSLFDPSSAFSEALAALQQSAEAQQRPVADLLAFIGMDDQTPLHWALAHGYLLPRRACHPFPGRRRVRDEERTPGPCRRRGSATARIIPL